ncbi:MAG TPA: LysR family transcriptional regulator, partial [Clostridia bacterium]|nr:LysR family transcriptional regulator [Clostridia bacterium]
IKEWCLLNYLDIEIFLTIVATKSITKTADILFLSQPTISHRLRALENNLGVPLMVRSKGQKSIQLTSKGEEFIPVAQRWVTLMKEANALKYRQESFFIVLGCTDSLNIALLAPFYRHLLEVDTRLDLCVQTHQSSELYTLLENHEIDIAFVYHNLYYKNVIAEELFHEKLYLIQSDPPVITKNVIHTKELDPNKEIFLSWDNNYQIWHDQWITSIPRPRVVVDTISLAFRLWNQAQYWMIAPASVIQEFSKMRPFFISELENRPPDRVCYKVTHKNPSSLTNESVRYFGSRLSEFLATKDFAIPTGKYFVPD